jgi:type I restriction enzyme S subunit
MSETQCFKFGDMAHQITTKVNPKDTSLNTYVGLEHLDTGSLQIKRRGMPQDVIGEKLRVCKGDIIFGKRRVYQRKVAIADFDGICSAHAMVLRPKENVIDKDFFPFFMQSDQFMERALQISVGSLSPTINWKTLANQEFTIPSLPVQRRIATTLWAVEDCIVKGERFLAVADRAKQALMRILFRIDFGHKNNNFRV